ncbi:MAG TPA: bifunctional pyr operon transcriptional regulator/uracil phosphoribosyltransferase PyrR [Dehalococcoidia bacterium]|jgi:pyrimidine operon attenuation protein/uracil phosphoribosyltransferase|nr:bifunctional pyr operon transcriptional regulator/uracil phosphoribosyltransferase PyrR [Dehalococcoidia bacterium]
MSERVLLTAEDLRRAIVRIAHEILEAHRGSHDLVLLGMHTRGLPLARRLATAIEQIEGDSVPVGALDIGLYRDDLSTRGAQVQLAPGELSVDVSGKRIVLVDDVLFTGRSVRAALDAIIDMGRPQRIQLAVLIDRGHRELPIRPDYIGKNVPTARGDDVRVRLIETDGRDEVAIMPEAFVPGKQEVSS